MTSIKDGKVTGTQDDTFTPQTCDIVIYRPHIAGSEVLQTISNLNQRITDLWITGLEVGDDDVNKIKEPVFKMDPEARNVNLSYPCRLPSLICKDLGRQLTSCHKLQVLRIPEQPDIAQEVVNSLENLTNITRLDLDSCHPTEDQCSAMC